MGIVKVGQKAPEFTMLNQDEKEIKLSDFKGKQVVLAWHPMAFTGVCTDQMRDLENNFEKFKEKNAVALGANIDHVPTKKAWGTAISIAQTDLVSDFKPFAKVTKDYGVYNEMLGTSGRAVVIIDEEGNVKWVKEYELSTRPDINEILVQL